MMEGDVLIVGASGLIGAALAQRAESHGTTWVGTTRSSAVKIGRMISLDLLRSEEINALAVRPKITYLCAAATNLKRCEDDPSGSRRINVEQTLRLARRLHEMGSAIVFLSTSLVFDGDKPGAAAGAPLSPRTEYGRQKAEAEEALLRELERVAIVRLTKVVHSHFPLFLHWWSELRQGRAISPFSDMNFTPLSLDVAIDELWALKDDFRRDIFQLSGDAELSYAESAQLLATCRGLNVGLIQPQTAAQAGYRDYFPRHTLLAHHPIRAQSKPASARMTLERIFRGFEKPPAATASSA